MALINDLYLRVMNFVNRDEEGQGLAEYALILALIAIVAIIRASTASCGLWTKRLRWTGGGTTPSKSWWTGCW